MASWSGFLFGRAVPPCAILCQPVPSNTTPLPPGAIPLPSRCHLLSSCVAVARRLGEMDRLSLELEASGVKKVLRALAPVPCPTSPYLLPCHALRAPTSPYRLLCHALRALSPVPWYI